MKEAPNPLAGPRSAGETYPPFKHADPESIVVPLMLVFYGDWLRVAVSVFRPFMRDAVVKLRDQTVEVQGGTLKNLVLGITLP